MPYEPQVINAASDFATSVDPLDVIRSFDIDSDVPLRQGLASGLLRMSAALRSDAETRYGQIVELGTFWCEIVHADVEYRLDDGLRLVMQSEPLATDLAESLTTGIDDGGQAVADQAWTVTDLVYVLSRWHDGAGKIRYRTTAYSRAVRDFTTAWDFAQRYDLWWLLPDLKSNHLRARFEELRQGLARGSEKYREVLGELTRRLSSACKAADAAAGERGIAVAAPDQVVQRRRDRPQDVEALRALEFLRGYSSLLHNQALAINDDAQREPAERIAASRRLSVQAAAISTALNDRYRLPQSLQQQAVLAEAEMNLDEARRLFDEVIHSPWRRGALIARQRRARLPQDAAERAVELKTLLDTDLDPGRGSITGSDLDIRAWTVRFYAAAAREVLKERRGGGSEEPSAEEQTAADALAGEIQQYELRSVRAVRQVIALPMYKQGYADLVRPMYTNATTLQLSLADKTPHHTPKEQQRLRDEAFAYVEESSARELLDMLAARNLARLNQPPTRVGETAMAELRAVGRPADDVERRRGTATAAAGEAVDDVTAVMEQRAEEFEATLQRDPLEIAPHDPEIAYRVMMLAANNPRAALVRYFLTGHGEDQRVAAFIATGRQLKYLPGPLRSDVSRLANTLLITRAPDELEAGSLWALLVEDVWRHLDQGRDIDHLVLVPTDEMFALPLHAARPRRQNARPLGVEVAMSYSVSATAYVSRGRHLLRQIAVDADDDLVAVVGVDAADRWVSGGEIEASGWRKGHVAILGAPPKGTPDGVTVLDISWEGMRQIEERKPEFLVYIGHGGYTSEHAELGPYLMLPGDVMTQFDVALRVRLPHNKLTVLGACVAAQGMASSGGEVAGFVRSLMAAGAGAIALPLWSATDESLVNSVGSLLQASRTAAETTGLFDVAESLRAINAEAWTRAAGSARPLEALPLALYL